MKVYSGFSGIPEGKAPRRIAEGCLVLEGGAFRGVYTAGVLDVMMREGINLRCVVGCSAGALNGLNYMAGQIGRTGRINLGYRHDPRYVGGGPLRREGSLISFDFLFRQTEAFEPLDRGRFYDPARRYAVVAADCETGEAVFPERDTCGDIFRAIQASASMPYVSRMVDVDGHKCLDGGCCCKIPYAWATDQGYEKLVIVRTREIAFRKPPAKAAQKRLAERAYRRYPAFAEKLARSDEDYNAQCDAIDALARSGRAFVIAPSEPVRVGRLERDMEKLGALYWLGYHDAQRQLEALRDYLELR